jgi:hypothetical protein
VLSFAMFLIGVFIGLIWAASGLDKYIANKADQQARINYKDKYYRVIEVDEK